ncbi:MAG: Jag N-terminal domain-containing protein [Armatimonadetes bacterium]|nr:Jag N-terminal domain-containing protein [Armatimonadota bacterium]
MATHEFTGKNVDEATKAAAEALGVDAKKLKVTVIEQTKGLFGKGSVKISVEAPESKAKKPAKTAPSEEAPAAEAPAKEKKGGKKAAKAEPEAKVEEAPAKPEPKGRGKKKAETAPEPAVEAPAAEASGEEPEIVATQEDADRILETVLEVIGSGGFQVNAHVAGFQGRYVNVVLDGQGKELGYLVGKNGEVLNALQYLLNIICSQKARNGVRLTLDANDYRLRREQALSKYAEEIAFEVNKRREEAVLDPLPAFERRIIHKALSGIKGVQTYSEGEEPNRRVVIAPVD